MTGQNGVATNGRKKPGPKPGSKRQPGSGRKKGTRNKITRDMRDAIMLAAELEGEDGRGKGKLVGYLRQLKRTEPRSFAMLVAKIVPQKVDVTGKLTLEQLVAGSMDPAEDPTAAEGRN